MSTVGVFIQALCGVNRFTRLINISRSIKQRQPEDWIYCPQSQSPRASQTHYTYIQSRGEKPKTSPKSQVRSLIPKSGLWSWSWCWLFTLLKLSYMLLYTWRKSMIRWSVIWAMIYWVLVDNCSSQNNVFCEGINIFLGNKPIFAWMSHKAYGWKG